MAGRHGRRISRRRVRSTVSPLGRSPRRRSTPDRVARLRRGGVESQGPHGTQRAISVCDRLANATASARVAAALLGVTVALVVSGLTQRLHTSFAANPFVEPFAPSRAMVVGASLLALAIGVRVPQRLAIWVCMLAWRRFVREGRARDVSGVLVSPGAPDRKLYWAVFSLVTLAAGVSVALLPVWIPVASGVYEFLHVHFVWSHVPLGMLNFLVSILAGLVPLALLGLALSCAHHLCCARGQWDTRATAWAVIGAGLGVWVAAKFADSSAGVDPLLIGAALPSLLVAIGAAALGSTHDDRAASPGRSAPTPLPECSDRWPTLLRASIIAVGGGSVCAVCVSSQWLSLGRVGVVGLVGVGEILAPLLLALGAGIALGCRAPRATVRTIGAFGMCCAIAGIVVGVGTYALSMQTRVPLWLAMIVSACGAGAIGYATSYGRTVLLDRVARRSTAGARMFARQLISGAAMILVAAPLATHLFSEPATLMLLAMSLIAVGGLLVIYEPSYTPQVRRARLVTVFGSVAAMILLGSMSAVSRVPPSAVELGDDVETASSPEFPSETHEVAAGDR